MNYLLTVDGQEPVEFAHIDAAINRGMGGKFVIWHGDLFCCISHPDLGLIYSEEYKEWYQACQQAHQKAGG